MGEAAAENTFWKSAHDDDVPSKRESTKYALPANFFFFIVHETIFRGRQSERGLFWLASLAFFSTKCHSSGSSIFGKHGRNFRRCFIKWAIPDLFLLKIFVISPAIWTQ